MRCLCVGVATALCLAVILLGTSSQVSASALCLCDCCRVEDCYVLSNGTFPVNSCSECSISFCKQSGKPQCFEEDRRARCIDRTSIWYQFIIYLVISIITVLVIIAFTVLCKPSWRPYFKLEDKS